MPIKITLLLLALAFVPVAAKITERVEKCSKIPNDKGDHVGMLERNSMHTYIYLSNKPEAEFCLALGYYTVKPGPDAFGYAFMYNTMYQRNGMNGIRAWVNITNLPDNEGWKVESDTDPKLIYFKVVFFDPVKNYLCAYTCDPADDTIMNWRCICNNETILDIMQTDIKSQLEFLPFKDNGKPVVVYTEQCRKTGTILP